MKVRYHRLATAEVGEVYAYYHAQGGEQLAERFLAALLDQIAKALDNPKRYSLLSGSTRRANLAGFPYHFLYVPKPWGLRILVVRHHRRRPDYGLSRR